MNQAEYVIKIVGMDNYWVVDGQQRTMVVGYAKKFATYAMAENYIGECLKNHYYQIERIYKT